MAFLRDVTDRVWQYISPRKTQQRREKPFKVPAVPTRAKSIPLNYTPQSTPKIKVTRWQGQVKTPGSANSVDATLLPPSPPTSVEPHDLEGDTLIAESVEQSPVKGASSSSTSNEDDEWDANESTRLVDEAHYLEARRTSDAEKEKQRREIQGRELRDAGWTEDAVFLFQKLGLRGFEPLMPASWVNDFETLPMDLFTANDNLAFIKSDSGADFRAQHALGELFSLGGFARDAVLTRAPIRTPEYHIRATVQKYNRWATKDAGVDRNWRRISLFEVSASDKYTKPSDAEDKMIAKLAKLQKRWVEAFDTHNINDRSDSDFVAAPEELPTIYGVIASYTVMAFVSYVAPTHADGKASLRTIAMFDFSEPGYDVWNALAISIFVIHCRNRMKELWEFLPECELSQNRDPDL